MANEVRKKRNNLTLKMKYEVIQAAEREPGIGTRKLATSFKCGRTQIQTILKNKQQITDLFMSNASSSLVQYKKRSRTSEYVDINEALYGWYQLVTRKNIFPDGKLLMEKAMVIAKRLLVDSFKGWLTRWKARYNLSHRMISGESGDVRSDTVDSWMERLPSIVAGYDARDIWNCDETGCYWKALPDKGLAEKKKECKGGKKSKLRVTICFFVNAVGETENPPVIWKSENPRCFNKSQLPVSYYSQTKSWMDGEILCQVLSKINRKLVRSKRSVLLMMDNAGCHPTDISDKFSNIKVVFLPANTTSKLQPLDLGVIQNFKSHYRTLFMRYVLTKIEECDSASDVVKSVTVLQAVRWIAEAWRSVDSSTIKKCFRKAGILDKDFNVVKEFVLDSDPFDELDQSEVDPELLDLMQQTSGPDHCSHNCYTVDDNVATCFQMDDEHWEEDFFAGLEPPSKHAHTEGNDSSDDEGSEDIQEDPSPSTQSKIKSYTEALSALEEISSFLQSKGNTLEANRIMDCSSNIASLHYRCLSNSRQTTLLEFVDQ